MLLPILPILLACGSAPRPAMPTPAPRPPPAAPERPDLAHQQEVREALRAALGDAYDQPVPGLDEARASRGQPVYDEHCGHCHGDSGKGQPGAGDLTDPAFRDAYSEAGRLYVIRHGIAGTDMPGFEGQLDDQQMLDVLDFVRKMLAPGDQE
ncbi:MAG: cytochrome c [Myxococcales bacterium]|nr:cytochrome c [Myxococcales bacterium]